MIYIPLNIYKKKITTNLLFNIKNTHFLNRNFTSLSFQHHNATHGRRIMKTSILTVFSFSKRFTGNTQLVSGAIKTFNFPTIQKTSSLLPMRQILLYNKFQHKFIFEKYQPFPTIHVTPQGVAYLTPQFNPLSSTAKINASLGVPKPDVKLDSSTLQPQTPVVVTLKTISGKDYTTSITDNTTIDTISDSDLILELKKRELIVDDLGNTAVEITLDNNNVFTVGGNPINKIKLRPLGQAYVKRVMEKNPSSNKSINLTSTKDNKFIIIIAPQNKDNVFIEGGHRKHMLVVYDSNNKEYYAIGYLTSKNSGQYLSDQKIKTFQNEKNNIFDEKNINDSQKIVRFKKALKIKEEDIVRIQWDAEYINTLSNTSLELLEKIWTNLIQQTYEEFTDKDITKEHSLAICKEHDKTVLSGDKHPLTEDQIKQNEENKIKQQLNSKKKPLKQNDETFIKH